MDDEFFSMDFDGSQELSFNPSFNTPLLTPATLRVYAAGSLTNNSCSVNQECVDVRKIIKRVLERYDYEGVNFRVYDPGENTSPGSEHSPDEVYRINYEQCVSADLLIFHVNVPSLGVGCEAQIAADATVPKIVLTKKNIPVSR